MFANFRQSYLSFSIKMQPENKPTSKKKSSVKDAKINNDSDGKRVNILAWLMLTVGIALCIIASVICMVVWYSSANNSSGIAPVHDIDSSLPLESVDIADESPDYPLVKAIRRENQRDFTAEALVTDYKQGCYEVSCHIECAANENIYADTAAVMKGSDCEVFAGLSVTNLNAKSIKNHWISVNTSVLQILIRDSQFSAIKSGAFSAPMFAQVFHMSWSDLKVEKVDRGALLGLYALRKLDIDFKMPITYMAFLQPVQLTLTHLRLNAGIIFKNASTVFENILMTNLIHLDLSANNFSGSLCKHMFKGTPNVTYLYLRNCHISTIEDNAFADIAGKLLLVDLRNNFLTRLSADVFYGRRTRLLLDMEPNLWHCNCQLLSLIRFFNRNKHLFISLPYCRTPFNLYGKTFDQLTAVDLNCDLTNLLQDDIQPRSETTYDWTAQTVETSDTTEDSAEIETKIEQMIQLPCTQAINLEGVVSQESHKYEMVENDDLLRGTYSGKLAFLVPNYDLKLELFENDSVRASIDEYNETTHLNIIWFPDDAEFGTTLSQTPMDYNCMQYEQPQLIIEQVQRNHTYTFCMLPIDQLVISPLFCQPLHVPIKLKSNESSWSAETEKHFTIAMLCLIFFVSIVIGAIFAYLGIKSFPQLLEGSKNVLVIKESQKSCCVSTIADSEYIKPNKFGQQISEIYSTASLTKLPSIISTSTLFEESFYNADAQSLDYEMPIKYQNELSEGSHKDTQLDRPNTPPPLPKRNSNLSFKLEQKLKDSQDI